MEESGLQILRLISLLDHQRLVALIYQNVLFLDEKSELSDVPTNPRPRKKARVVESPAETEKKKPSRKSKEPLSKDEQNITSLKSYIRTCGVRRVWSQDLNGLSPKEQIRKLQQQLQALGVEGRPTIAKCKQVAYQRELKAECESVAMNPIAEKEDKEKRRIVARRDQSMAALKAKRKSESVDTEIHVITTAETQLVQFANRILVG
ncbi:hypothetical protein IWQ62_001669 [Dispira parvispora]|uniref:Uncharacterized protein n=1 Tax=Dispira parvispora TaxID=1520584 RepID=A0A9W8E3K2_9FUNG|nr:hypothetical protein IWQ62_001669 [Dispira parvispora]